ncbi:transglycosylase family protein [Streptomyces sp. NPDC060027]|uniref:LysM peptidoglycan-binding domain-containing protein n=1 Tax=Streptomyces sp. NPDC060027 TaxID=3347040 RepID=UPI00367DA034
MLSGNGRHRRPRQAPALIVAAGVTGSAIAIPLLAATSASAADGTTWDRVAQCESGGAWSADNSNGYYGGLQLTQDDWEAYGGLEYAPRADQASRSQQIAVAEKVLDDQGLAAWPTCGPLSGLSADSGDVRVDTGLAGDSSAGGSESSGSVSSGLSTTPNSSPSSIPSGSADSGDSPDVTDNTAKPSASQDSGSSDKATGKDDKSDKSGQDGASSDASDDASASTGRHRGGSADEDASAGAADDRTDSAAGRHASRGSSDSRDATDDSYVVDDGDSLWSIADALDLEGGWGGLYVANEDTVGADPDLIVPGQSLSVATETVEK